MSSHIHDCTQFLATPLCGATSGVCVESERAGCPDCLAVVAARAVNLDEPGGPCMEPAHAHGPYAADGVRNTRPAPSRTTALGISCPWSGDEHEPRAWAYTVWFWLYRTTRRLRHRLGLHDWVTAHVVPARTYCTWCGVTHD